MNSNLYKLASTVVIEKTPGRLNFLLDNGWFVSGQPVSSSVFAQDTSAQQFWRTVEGAPIAGRSLTEGTFHLIDAVLARDDRVKPVSRLKVDGSHVVAWWFED